MSDTIKETGFTPEEIKAGQDKLNIVFATATLADGTEKEITAGFFLDLLQRGLNENNPDAEATEKLALLLESMLAFADTLPDLLTDPVAAKTLEAMRTILDYLQQGASTEEIDLFLKGAKEFMVIPRPVGIEDLLSINDTRDKEHPKVLNNTKITFNGRLSIDEQKIHDMIRLVFANNNYHGATKNLNECVALSITEIMEMLDRPVNPNNKKYFRRMLKNEMLDTIARQYIEIENSEGVILRGYVGSDFLIEPKKDRVLFYLGHSYAEYLNTGALSQISYKTFKLGNRDKPLPYYLAIKLQDQYFHDGNRKRHTNCILSIKALLKFSADMIPTYEYVQQTDKGHWARRIREPLENALRDIQNIGLFKWEYCKKGLAEATPKEYKSNDFRIWSELYINFELIPDEPNQSERLSHKRERLEAAEAKKAVKDAEKIIKADKIEKRKAKKNSKASKKS